MEGTRKGLWILEANVHHLATLVVLAAPPVFSAPPLTLAFKTPASNINPSNSSLYSPCLFHPSFHSLPPNPKQALPFSFLRAEIYRIVTRKTLEAGGDGPRPDGNTQKIVLNQAGAKPKKGGCC